MKKIMFALSALVLLLAVGAGHSAWAQSEPGYYDQSDQNLLTPEELMDLLAPIALYPDPLIAQILPAATFIDQIDEAARYVRQFGKSARVDDQPWDVSVKAVAHYPSVLFMMDQKYDWTVSLGQAFIDQPQDVMDAIQDLRADAEAQGNLVSTREQQVIVEEGDIRIVPAAPEYIYVPVYDPQVIYVERHDPSFGFITFGAGFAIGAWLSRDLDWRGHRVYYHGWKEGGWVGRSRSHISDRRGIYINQRATVVNTNKRVLQHDTNRFRQELRQDVERRRTQPGRPAPATRPRPGRTDQQRPPTAAQPRTPAATQQRPPAAAQPRTPAATQQRPPAAAQQRPPAAAQSRPPAAAQPRQPAAAQPGTPAAAQHRPPAAAQPGTPAAAQPRQPAATQHRPPAAPAAPAAAPAPAAAQQPAPAPVQQRTPASGSPGARDVFRGRDVQQVQPASRSGYGGYGSGKDATTYRERGQTSRENMRQAPAPVQKPAGAPAPRPSVAPAPRPSVAPAAKPNVAPAPRAIQPHAPRPVIPHSPAAAPAARPAGQPSPPPAAPGGRGGREEHK